MTHSLKNHIALITGASSGIGKACAERLAAQGAHLILTARRMDRIEELAHKLQKEHAIRALPICLDVTQKEKVITAMASLPSDWKEVSLLINNAGLALSSAPIQEGNLDNWERMIDTNVKGLLYVTHAILPGMIERNAGHIVNIGSIAGHETYPGGNIYTATKHAVRAISKSLRIDLLGKAIRVSEIDPGCVETEFSEVRWGDKKRAKDFYHGFTPLIAEDIADAVLYCTTRPPHVNIAEMIIFPTEQASANHLHRQGQETKGMLK